MKVVLLCFLGIASAAKQVTCDECKAAAAGLVERLTTDESIEEQAGIIIATVCPQASDSAACEAGVGEYWGAIAGCLYPTFIGADDACIKVGLCTEAEPILRDWTCEDLIKEPDVVQEGIELLQGDCFCKQPGHTDACPAMVAELVPPAMEVLSGVLVETTTELHRLMNRQSSQPKRQSPR